MNDSGEPFNHIIAKQVRANLSPADGQIIKDYADFLLLICVIFDQAFIFMVTAWLLLLLVRGRHHHWQRWHEIQIDNKHLDEDPSGAVLIQLNE